jgi:manganese transport protein
MATATQAAELPSTRQRHLWYYIGPAFVASIAYIDPGNFATNFEGGTRFGYQLLWVLLWSNAMAILIQYLSAKLGIATGHTLPENCRIHFSRPMTIFLWLAAEVSALATDLAEFLGAALGFYLLLGPRLMAAGLTRTHVLLLAAVATTVCVFLILALQHWGFRRLELVIMVFVGVIGGCYAAEMFFIHPQWNAVAYHMLVPQLDSRSLYLAVAMLGATVMPHVVYLHSGLVQPRVLAAPNGRRHADGTPILPFSARMRLLRMELIDLVCAMNGAWLVNSAMIVVAAAAFSGHHMGSMSIETAHATLGPLLGRASATLFAVALLCSGLSSSTVGTMAGQMVLEGFLQVRFSIFLRRLITLLPALVVIGIGLDPLRILLLSQAALSFTLPFALIPLLILTQRAGVMDRMVNGRLVQTLGWASTAVIVSLNVVLLWQLLGG